MAISSELNPLTQDRLAGLGGTIRPTIPRPSAPIQEQLDDIKSSLDLIMEAMNTFVDNQTTIYCKIDCVAEAVRELQNAR